MTSALMTAFVFLSWNGQVEDVAIKKILQGSIKDVKNNSITIWDGIKGSKVRIIIDSTTAFENSQKKTDIAEGDIVKVAYREEHGKKIAAVITKCVNLEQNILS